MQQDNNANAHSLYIGRGANMPYTMDEAEDATTGGGEVVGPNRTIGDLAGEASGRQAVVLDATGDQPEHPVTDTVFTDVTITGAQLSGDEFEHKSGFGIWVNEMPEPGQGPAVGSAVFHNLQMSGNHQDIKNTTSTFDLIID